MIGVVTVEGGGGAAGFINPSFWGPAPTQEPTENHLMGTEGTAACHPGDLGDLEQLCVRLYCHSGSYKGVWSPVRNPGQRPDTSWDWR